MDVSDIKLLQSIYYILQASVSIRSALSLSEFRSFLLSELRKQGFLIELLDDQFHLYTFEDYIKDFELDYLGFDGVPDEPVSGVTPEKISENKPAPEPSDSGEDIHLL